MLYALGDPIACAALVCAFLFALLLRAFSVRFAARSLGLADGRESIVPRLREDIDVFGAVAAAVGGTGWGKMLSVDEIPRWRGRGRAALVFAAGPLSCIIVAQLFFLAHRIAYPGGFLLYFDPSTILLGQIDGVPIGEKVLLSLGTGLLSFGVLAVIPIPPLDGFGVLYNCMRKPGATMQWMRLWFEEKNIGIVVLLALCLFQIGSPYLLIVLDLLGGPFLRLWD